MGRSWDLRGAEREDFVRRLFDRIAAPYDRLNRLISLGRDGRWRRLAVVLAEVGPGSRVLDLGTGTGDLAFAFAEAVGPAGRVAGVDIAAGMLRLAAAKRNARGAAAVSFHQAGASATGVSSNWADAVSMGWVLRNVGDRPATYREVLRVLKPGGRFVSVDMSRPRGLLSRAGFYGYRHLLMPLLARAAGGDVTAYRYLAGSTDGFPDARTLEGELRDAGFARVTHRPLMLGALAIHVGRKP